MRVVCAHLKSSSPYSQSRYYNTPKLEREIPRDFEARTWRDRCHVNEEGFVFIPPMAFKNCLSDAAKYLSMQVPCKGKNTYTKHFEAGLMVMDPLVLPLRKEDVQGEWLYVPSDGKRGGGSRVEKCYPCIPSWEGEVTIYLLDEIITTEVLRHHLNTAGLLVGIGRFRPRNNGYYGRFEVLGLTEQ